MNKPKTIKTAYKIRLKKGDTVMVRQGKDKGKTGVVSAVHPRDNKVTVEGINIVKKHQKPNRDHPQGGIVELTKPVWVSKVGIIDTTSKQTAKPIRIGYRLDDSGVKVRFFKSNGKDVPGSKQ